MGETDQVSDVGRGGGRDSFHARVRSACSGCDDHFRQPQRRPVFRRDHDFRSPHGRDFHNRAVCCSD